MADLIQRRRIRDSGLQPERTSLAWFRTALAFCALSAVSVRSRHGSFNVIFYSLLFLSCFVTAAVYLAARQRRSWNSNLIGLHIDATDRTLRVFTLALLGVVVLSALPLAAKMFGIPVGAL